MPTRATDLRPWRVVAAAGPISANVYHCATVGLDQAGIGAVIAADRTNAEHWRPAKAGERGYARLDKRKRNGNG